MEQYELYCLADRLFYDTPANRGTEVPDFAAGARPVPSGWDHQAGEVWMNYAPAGLRLPAQGWKIHVSAGLDDAERAIAAIWDYCVPRGLAFKFLRSKPVAVMLNSKSAFRGSSGKLVTVYPTDEAQLELVLKELDTLLAGIQGPYILSDLRYAAGPLFVRYGAFVTRYCLSDSGERVYALADAEGRLVPDVRGPTFSTPAWVQLPSFLESHLAARNAVTTNDLAYVIESVIQFSNGGGVYLGHHRDSEAKVVLKEGRPLAGLDVIGRDAVARVGHERDILQRLAGLDVVPAVHDYFTLGDHHFLVQEFVDSNPLQRLIGRQFPLTRPDSSAGERAEYAEWALGMHAQVEQAVAALHERGVVFNDIHPGNVLVDENGRLVLIDFEVATLATEQARSALAHPGYAAPADRQGVDVDRYALACLALGLFAPQSTMLLHFHPHKANQLADLISTTFSVPRATFDAAVATIVGDQPVAQPDPPIPGVAPWPEVRAAITQAIVAGATPERDDRLFPGDIQQFEPGGGVNLAHGAAGVLYALARSGAGRFPEYDEWLRRHARDAAIGPGLYSGLHGIALVLTELGYHQDAGEVIDRCLQQPAEVQELGLYSGLAGIGLTLLEYAAQPAVLAAATRVVDQVADRLGGPDDVAELSGEGRPRAGLMYGSAGPALLFLHAYERSGDTGLLDLARIALQQDLRRCTTDDHGMLQVNQGWRTLPYLEEGSVGIALVLQRYLRHRPDDELAPALEALRRVTHCGYFVQPGLFMGRAGLLLAATELDPGVNDQLIAGLAWHALPYAGGLAFPGNQLLRLSADLATGSAGVLLALGAALHEQPVALPFFGRNPPSGPFEPRKEV
ncbi:class III lanthionine synthetase LanKC [Kribbella sp. CA-293567]|uniref:class III lanthionine synthetase LanKC n=1 Tax=Kribbella sp. CA-293567 TaxID=3002436 RepID=UPI0022DE8ED4|nr:class III lanthionine synthetase LanKC [Kribbella sp. CA-293567]WBQ08234.1 class III lanthionine synthetase LanKC [Kribbella sp. CA-293567]